MKNAFQLLGAEGATLTFALLAVLPTRTVFSYKIGYVRNKPFFLKLGNFSKNQILLLLLFLIP